MTRRNGWPPLTVNAVLAARDYGLTYSEIERITGVPISTARSWILGTRNPWPRTRPGLDPQTVGDTARPVCAPCRIPGHDPATCERPEDIDNEAETPDGHPYTAIYCCCPEPG